MITQRIRFLRFKSTPTFLVVASLGLAGGTGCDLLPGTPLPCRDAVDCAPGESCVAEYCTAAAPVDGGPLRDGGAEPDPQPADSGVEPDPQPVDSGVEPEPNPDDAGPDGGGSDDDAGPDGGGPSDDAGPDGGGPGDAGIRPLPPEAISTFDVAEVMSPPLDADVVVDAFPCDNALIFSTDAASDPWSAVSLPEPPINCESVLSTLNGNTRLVRRGEDGPDIAEGLVVAAAKSWTFSSDVEVRVRGDDRVAFFGEDFIAIDGRVEASGLVSNLGPVDEVDVEDGPGGIVSGANCVGSNGATEGNEGGGGGGGGGATPGAPGGNGKDGAVGGAGGADQEPTDFSGLAPGCRGGKGAKSNNPGDNGGNGGPAGGAIQFVSLGDITGTGSVRANGGRGLIGRRTSKDGGGGGGSGGTIWLVGGRVNFGGVLMANGGAGAGSGGVDGNETGHFGARAALGRSAIGGSCGDSYTGSFPDNTECGSGGAGGWRVAPTPGYTATAEGGVSGGGGGGAAGRIYISSANACNQAPRSSPEVAIPTGAFNAFACAFDAPVCGDGVVTANAETCDEGANLFPVARCGCNGSCQESTSCGAEETITNDTTMTYAVATDRRFIVPATVTFDAELAGAANARVDCEAGSHCRINCNSLEQSCQVVCEAGATCDLRCNSVGEEDDPDACVLFCEEGATCSVSQCNSVGGDPPFCALLPFTTIPLP